MWNNFLLEMQVHALPTSPLWLRSSSSTLLRIRRSHRAWINPPSQSARAAVVPFSRLTHSEAGVEADWNAAVLSRHEAAAAARAAVMWISWTNKEGDKQQHHTVFLNQGKMLYVFLEAAWDIPAKTMHGNKLCPSLLESGVHFVTPVQN